jgi:hypothetical protein
VKQYNRPTKRQTIIIARRKDVGFYIGLSFRLAIILFVFSSGYYIVYLFVRLLYCLSFGQAIILFIVSLAFILFVFSSGYYIVCLFVLLLYYLSFRQAIILFIFSIIAWRKDKQYNSLTKWQTIYKPDEKTNNIIAWRKDKQYNNLTKRQTI